MILFCRKRSRISSMKWITWWFCDRINYNTLPPKKNCSRLTRASYSIFPCSINCLPESVNLNWRQSNRSGSTGLFTLDPCADEKKVYSLLGSCILSFSKNTVDRHTRELFIRLSVNFVTTFLKFPSAHGSHCHTEFVQKRFYPLLRSELTSFTWLA